MWEVLTVEMEELILDYIYDENDSKRQNREIYRSKEFLIPTISFQIIIILVYEGMNIGLGLMSGFSTWDIIWMVIYPIILLLFMSLFSLWLTKLARKLEQLPRNCRVKINNSGLEADFTNETHSTKWDYLRKVIERKEFISFRIQIGTIYSIPKRVLDNTQLEFLRNILRINLDDKKLKLLIDNKANN